MILVALTLAATAQIGEAFMKGDEFLVASTPADAAAVFQRVCLAPFPDAQAFRAAAARDRSGLTEAGAAEVGQIGKGGAIMPAQGGLWHAERVTIRYFASGALSPKLPQPQCKVTVRLADAPDQTRLAAIVGIALKLEGAHELKVGPHTRTYWDIPQAAGSKWRVMLKSEACPCGNFMSIGVVPLAASPDSTMRAP